MVRNIGAGFLNPLEVTEPEGEGLAAVWSGGCPPLCSSVVRSRAAGKAESVLSTWAPTSCVQAALGTQRLRGGRWEPLLC